MGRVVLRKNVSEKLSIIDPLLKEEKPLQFESTNIAAKKPQPLLWNRIEKGAGEKRKICDH
jgi:hypothetical protein